MDKTVVLQKLQSLQRCSHRFAANCTEDAFALAEDLDSQDIVILNLSRGVQLCVDIGSHLIDSSDRPVLKNMIHPLEQLGQTGVISADLAIRLQLAGGLSGNFIDDHEGIDWQAFHAMARDRLADFAAFARAIGAHLSKA
jgi:uncharacterized protein YutE (UPF0331/DUF86 family)